jgi:hypothetical protein
MNNIVYHLFCVNDGLQRFNKTYLKIKNSNLINNVTNIHVNCVGPEKELFSSTISDHHKVTIHLNDYAKSEVTSIDLVQKLANENLGGNTLYLHSKGASNKWNNPQIKPYFPQKKDCIDAWVDFMEYFLIEKYKDCLKFLKTYNTCGCNRSITGGSNYGFEWSSWHYSGNFWWAKNKYLSSIPACKKEDYSWPETVFLNGMNAELGEHKELARSEHVWPEILTNKLNPKNYRK